MRPIRLDLNGFGSYADTTTLDFSDVEFFALTGPTGAGKSTVLDSICFALYGRTPRLKGKLDFTIAPSATEGSVRFVFAAGANRYVLTRTLRRSKQGQVKTQNAGIERLPADVDVTDANELTSGLGTPLATGANKVNTVVEKIIGLPFEQFTKSVLLPQGEFAQFLHATAAERRNILENLLGHGVYADIQRKAAARRDHADTTRKTLDAQLAKIPTVGDADLSHAEGKVTELDDLSHTVRQRAEELDNLTTTVTNLRERLTALDADLSHLTYVKRPHGLDDLTERFNDAAEKVAAKAADVENAEADDERLREELAGLNLAVITRRIDAWHQLHECENNINLGTEMVDALKGEISEQRELVDAAREEVDVQTQQVEQARLVDFAGSLRDQLAEGYPCPVCDQEVDRLPKRDINHALHDAQQAVGLAKQELEDAEKNLQSNESKLITYETRLNERLAEQKRLKRKLAEAPDLAQLQEQQERAEAADSRLKASSTTLATARKALRAAQKRRDTIENEHQNAWHDFRHARDQVAGLNPPVAPDDLHTAWGELVDWAKARHADTRAARDEVQRELAASDDRAGALRRDMAGALAEVGVKAPTGGTGTDYITAHLEATKDARFRLDGLRESRQRRVDLESEIGRHVREWEVAKALADHLKANRFTGWLLSEALDELVLGASQTLNRISNGQYDLVRRDNEFWVIDHHDADLARPVRSLSGGETFAASLSLALALSDQLAAMASGGTALESILLDEGFGTLDPDSLDAVATTLEALTTDSNRMVGVVTHVADLANRVPVRYEVTKGVRGSRVEKLVN
ncbi:AAA family ATPase [Haloglycomyces albus]|uniref:AAA family ATPase n=1 Tax=Haloglycomyces albus TaxID=526067 RepID=UPI00046CD344|nr:SMC family ATPase [Haloglycomyces albus]